METRWNNLRLAPDIRQEVEESLSLVSPDLLLPSSPFSRINLLGRFILAEEESRQAAAATRIHLTQRAMDMGNQAGQEMETQSSSPTTPRPFFSETPSGDAGTRPNVEDLPPPFGIVGLQYELERMEAISRALLFDPTGGVRPESERMDAIFRAHNIPPPSEGVSPEGAEHPIIESMLAVRPHLRARWINLNLPNLIGRQLESSFEGLSGNDPLLRLIGFIQSEEIEGPSQDPAECEQRLTRFIAREIITRLAAATRAP